MVEGVKSFNHKKVQQLVEYQLHAGQAEITKPNSNIRVRQGTT